MMFGHDNNQDTQNDATAQAPPVPEPVSHDSFSSDSPVGAPTPPADDMGVGLGNDPAMPSGHSNSSDNTAAGSASQDLLTIKQQALSQLTPLVGHLDQTPEEKFRTTMMMIQGSDNQALIKDAYEAAQAITDEKARAQALLDIVNEINYFTQHPTS